MSLLAWWQTKYRKFMNDIRYSMSAYFNGGGRQ